MKKLMIVGVMMVVLVAVAGSALAASSNGRGDGTGQPMLDVSSPVTLAGTITDISHCAVGVGPSQGTADSYLLFRTTDSKDIRLMVGPSWYLQDLGLTLAVGNSQTVTGYYETDGDLVVASLAKDSKTFTLRDQTGRPLWAGSRGQGKGAGTGQAVASGNGPAMRGNGACPDQDQPASTAQPLRDGTGFRNGQRGNQGNGTSCDGTCPNCTAP
jgi:hypothetical protein